MKHEQRKPQVDASEGALVHGFFLQALTSRYSRFGAEEGWSWHFFLSFSPSKEWTGSHLWCRKGAHICLKATMNRRMQLPLIFVFFSVTIVAQGPLGVWEGIKLNLEIGRTMGLLKRHSESLQLWRKLRQSFTFTWFAPWALYAFTSGQRALPLSQWALWLKIIIKKNELKLKKFKCSQGDAQWQWWVLLCPPVCFAGTETCLLLMFLSRVEQRSFWPSLSSSGDRCSLFK